MKIRPSVIVSTIVPVGIMAGVLPFIGCQSRGGTIDQGPPQDISDDGGDGGDGSCPSVPKDKDTKLDAGVLEASPLTCTGQHCETEFEEVQKKKNEFGQQAVDCEDSKKSIKELAKFVKEQCEKQADLAQQYTECMVGCNSCIANCSATTGQECYSGSPQCLTTCSPCDAIYAQYQCAYNDVGLAEQQYAVPIQKAEKVDLGCAAWNAGYATCEMGDCLCENCTDGTCKKGDCCNVPPPQPICCMSGGPTDDPKGGPIMENWCNYADGGVTQQIVVACPGQACQTPCDDAGSGTSSGSSLDGGSD